MVHSRHRGRALWACDIGLGPLPLHDRSRGGWHDRVHDQVRYPGCKESSFTRDRCPK